MNNDTMTHQNRFETWKELAQRIRTRAEKLQRAQHEAGWALAATVGIPRDGCCLHNASIDDDLKGWCKDSPETLKVAKQAKHILDDWSASHLADRLIKRAWNRLIAKPSGWKAYELD